MQKVLASQQAQCFGRDAWRTSSASCRGCLREETCASAGWLRVGGACARTFALRPSRNRPFNLFTWIFSVPKTRAGLYLVH